jgi:hypothetical protein
MARSSRWEGPPIFGGLYFFAGSPAPGFPARQPRWGRKGAARLGGSAASDLVNLTVVVQFG